MKYVSRTVKPQTGNEPMCGTGGQIVAPASREPPFATHTLKRTDEVRDRRLRRPESGLPEEGGGRRDGSPVYEDSYSLTYPPPPCESSTKVPEFDGTPAVVLTKGGVFIKGKKGHGHGSKSCGNDTRCCSDTGVALAKGGGGVCGPEQLPGCLVDSSGSVAVMSSSAFALVLTSVRQQRPVFSRQLQTAGVAVNRRPGSHGSWRFACDGVLRSVPTQKGLFCVQVQPLAFHPLPFSPPQGYASRLPPGGFLGYCTCAQEAVSAKRRRKLARQWPIKQ